MSTQTSVGIYFHRSDFEVVSVYTSLSPVLGFQGPHTYNSLSARITELSAQHFMTRDALENVRCAPAPLFTWRDFTARQRRQVDGDPRSLGARSGAAPASKFQRAPSEHGERRASDRPYVRQP